MFDFLRHLLVADGAPPHPSEERFRLLENELARREAELRLVTDAVPDLISLVDSSHRYRFVNHAYEVWFGTEKEAIVGKHLRDVLGDQAYGAIRGHLEDALAGKRITYDAEVPYRAGGTRWIEATYTPHLLPDGRIDGVIALVHDATARKRSELLLGARTEHLRQLLEHTPAPVALLDRDLRYLAVSRRWLTDYGVVEADLVGKSHLEVFPDLPERWRAILRRCVAGETARADEDMWTRADGSVYWIQWEVRPWHDETGAVGGIVIYSENITARKRSEEARKAAEAALRVRTELVEALLRAAPLGVYVVGSDLRLRHANPVAIAACGFLEVEGRDLQEILAACWSRAQAEEIVRRFRRTLETGEAHFDPELATDRGDSGAREHYEWRIERIPLPDGAGVVCYFRDISARVRARESVATAQRAVNESEQRFRALADNIAQLAWMADEKGWLFWYNKRWLEYTGSTLEEMQGWGWRKVHHPDHVGHVIESWSRALASGEPWEDTFPLRSATGEFRWFLSRAFPIRDERGNVKQWFGTNTDVTEQREAQEKLRDAVRARDDFLSIASHELRTPLTPIQLSVQSARKLLRDRPVPDVERLLKKVETADQQIGHLTVLIEKLLDVSRITAGRLSLALEPVDLRAVVHEEVERQRPQLEAAHCPLSVRTPVAPVAGPWDRVRLAQVVANLLTNAAKYGKGKPVEVAVDVAGAVATLVVRDHGIGIAPEDQRRIFERFERAVSARNYGGFGLGLWISRQVVDAMGGSISVHSQPGSGAEFTVTLPLAPASGTSSP